MNDSETFLLMRRAGHILALPAALTRQALPLEDVAPLPAAAGVLLGLMPAAGRAVPVVNIDRVLGLNQGEGIAAKAPLLLMLESGDQVLGLPVDEVIGFISDDRPTFPNNALTTEEKLLGGYVGGGHKGRYVNPAALLSEIASRLNPL